MATLRHSSLPWNDSIAASPLTQSTGGRDRLSLVAQFAAHQALLQFAGIADGDVDPAEWVVVRKRGVDCRLVRIAARACDPDSAPPVLTLAQQFAELVGADLDVLAQSWARAELVYAEAFARLRGDIAADLTWTKRAAYGEIAAPGPEALRALAIGTYGYGDDACINTIASFHEHAVVLRGESPLKRYSALAALGNFDAGETEVAERIIAMRRIFIVANVDAFDEASRRVVELLMAMENATWVVPGSANALPDTRWFVLSPRIAARRALDEQITTAADQRAWVERFVMSDAFAAFVADGDLPPADASLPALAEPARSYVGALALLGTRIPRDLAERFLAGFLFRQPLEDLAVTGVTSVEGNEYVFESDPIREHAARSIPIASRPSICRVAASLTTGIRAAQLWIDAGEINRATEELENFVWSRAEEIVEVLHRMPRAVLSPPLARRYADALIDCGRYRDARDVLLTDEDREFVLARAERRTGDYESALSRLENITEGALLRAELLRLTHRYDEAASVLTTCDADDPRVAYELAILAYDTHQPFGDISGDDYLAARFATYCALRAEHFEEASALALQALTLARCAAERIDAWLDRLFATFSAGRWPQARAIAMAALEVVEETQGDRAAGGILFTLAYLAADDGQWAHASQRLARLRRYYSGTHDEEHLRELSLIAAHLDFSRGRFADARRAATTMLDGDDDQIREAAALIVDEIDWIEHRKTLMRSTGKSGNVELTRRHGRLTRLRRGEENCGTTQLEMFREALATGDRPTAQRIATELDLVLVTASPADAELRVLRTAATADFPFSPHDFEMPWCFATRNRLGHWNAIGLREVSDNDLDRILIDEAEDWIACSERELLFLEGSSTWSADGRDAISALFRTRAENQRLRRIIDQDEAARPATRAESLDGLVGDSAVMRDIYGRIALVARRDVAICILGESGTGKELVARAIHRNSTRRTKPFTAVNCAALPENLIESELFGHVRGAFTGADRDRAGLIETTDGGTLFLDEIGELPLSAQAKLLRFLQEGEFRRVGDTTNRSADVRIVSATNRKLESAVEEGRFRDDLYYRIRGVELALPALRERGSDITLLASHFLTIERDKHRSGPNAFTSEVDAIFAAYNWPGNVRELQNTIRAAHAMAGDAKQIALEHLPERLRRVAPARASAGSYQDSVMRFRRELIEKSLHEARGNQNRAASLLKISRQALAYQIRELGILVNRP
ncbi:MAG TPA: sigma 54-interacting transcriptional regulator [Thermoanaerobaculia bacterium]|nr:sigma 54-interacting transcriptional regulator [Thermoanaerobaculia bacterium]